MPTLVADLDSTGFVSGAYKMYASLSALVTYLSDAQRKMELMENTLVTYTGSIEGSKRVIEDLADISLRLGSNFEASVVPFAKLAGSIQTLSESETLNVFEGFQTALTATHASTQAVTGAWLALQQVVSKGKLNMQDLRRQLAEHIPGAMKIFADAAGMSMGQFEKAVREGSINAEEWLVKAADAMKENFGGAAVEAAKSLDAELNRLHTTSLLLRADFVESSGLNETFTGTVRELVGVLNGLDLSKLSASVGESATRTQELTEKFADATLKLVDFANEHSNVIGTLYDAALAVHPLHAGLERLELIYDKLIATEIEEGETVEQMEERKRKARGETTDKLRTSVEQYVISLQKQKVLEDEIVKEAEKNAKERTKGIEDMYKKIGVAGDEYHSNMRVALLEETKHWVEYGATQEQVTKYIEDTIAKSQGLLITMDELGNYTNMAGEETDRFGNILAYTTGEIDLQNESLDETITVAEQFADVFANDVTQSQRTAAVAIAETAALMEHVIKLSDVMANTHGTVAPNSGASSMFSFYGLRNNDSVSSNSSFGSNLMTGGLSALRSSSGVTNVFNQNISRNDVNNITSSQLRNANR